MESRACLPHSKFKEANTCCEFMAVQWNLVFRRFGKPTGLLYNKTSGEVPVLSNGGETCPGDSFVRGAAFDLSGIDFWQPHCCIFFFFGHTVRHAGSPFPDQGLNLHPLQWKHGVLTNGPPGNSHYCCILKLLKILFFFFCYQNIYWDYFFLF